MHAAVYVIAALTALGSLVMSVELINAPGPDRAVNRTIGWAILFYGLINAVLLATFGRMEEHLGAIRRHLSGTNVRSSGIASSKKTEPSIGTSPKVLTDGLAEDPDEPESVEEGRIGKREYQMRRDGTLRLKSLNGWKEFETLQRAREYVLGKKA